MIFSRVVSSSNVSPIISRLLIWMSLVIIIYRSIWRVDNISSMCHASPSTLSIRDEG